ncbi:vesicle-associated membrane protein 722 isoform X2 [Arabidopsis lyrata subsp. lyrata]|uniref:vesicle-associated membrane protein 722 isoform X2 n=1 Tax=Arabidopsis lyrata subsp. lyrata TaxID=81972 RepID=UPI000A29B853|nr:vesicle-associated membrane protein 722 isoform X2 [Arabidopsis lyrata subsp. lyrata]|eukprot:XP_020883980.1 vesicle-associated membrane protein 722 isoform X2 [Arabidopsis lyrata subsp. lyrata]
MVILSITSSKMDSVSQNIARSMLPIVLLQLILLGDRFLWLSWNELRRILTRDMVKAQVSEVKGVMMENIEKVLDRGEKIELLVDKTENLRSQAQDFRTQGTQMRRKMWFQNMKIKLIVLAIIIALILIIILSVCGGFNCGK